MHLDIEKKWLSVYGHTPKGEGCWFFAFSAFRHRWEFGISCDFEEFGYDVAKSRYYLYAQQFNHEGLKTNEYQFPRKNRWTHVTS